MPAPKPPSPDPHLRSGRQEIPVVPEPEAIKLSPRDRDAFVNALFNPDPPNQALIAAMQWHAQITGKKP